MYFNGLVYITGNDQVASAFSVVGDQLVLSSQSTNVFGSPTNSVCGADPTISADVSVVVSSAMRLFGRLDKNTQQFFAYNASNLADELWASNQAANGIDETTGFFQEFLDPVVANGMVYVVTNGYLNAYGLIPSTATSLASDTTTQGNWQGGYGGRWRERDRQQHDELSRVRPGHPDRQTPPAPGPPRPPMSAPCSNPAAADAWLPIGKQAIPSPSTST